MPTLAPSTYCRGLPDVASPDDLHPCFCKRSRQAGRLRIVKQDHVARLHESENAVGVCASNSSVVGSVVDTELAAVAGRSVQLIMDPFRDDEELRVSTHDQPVHIDAGSERVAHEHLQHLGDASTLGRRTDVPDCPLFEPCTGHCGSSVELCITLSADEGLQVAQGAAGHEDLADWKSRGGRNAR